MYVYAVQEFRALLKRKRVLEGVTQCATGFGLHKVLEEHKPLRSHWHWKRSGVSGTLEVTWDIHKNQVLVIVHQNRVGADGWAQELAPLFAQALAETFEGKFNSEHAPHGN